MTKINKAKSRKFVVYYNRDLLEIKITDSEWSDIALHVWRNKCEVNMENN